MRVLLFSGGVESTCLAVMHRPDLLLTVDYGHLPAEGEKRASAYIAQQIDLPHKILTVPMRDCGSGDMAGCSDPGDSAVSESWPFRNQMLITLAAMKYVKAGLTEIMIGTVSTDCIHTDGSQEFIDTMNSVLHAQNGHLSVVAPAIDLTTACLVEISGVSRDLLGWTFSCHKSAVACGLCRGCNKTLELIESLKSHDAG